jgi:formate dehydrogenase subunit gamma
MSELSLRARREQDVVVGDQIIRHKLSSRAIHWLVSISFFVCLLTGMPIWSPLFGWMAYLFGGLTVCRWLHPLAGAAFFFFSLVMFFHWLREMNRAGKYNAGQRFFFFAVSLGALGLVISGVVLWFPASFGQTLREASLLLHDFTFILFTVGIIGHMYLGTAAEPGTFGAMVRGGVSKSWARFHHPAWFREVTGEEEPRA